MGIINKLNEELNVPLFNEDEIRQICDGIDAYDYDEYDDFLMACLDAALIEDSDENEEYNESVREIVYEYTEELYDNDSSEDDEDYDD